MVDILILFQDDAEDVATRIAWAAAERGYSVWGDPNHFASAPDEEIEAAARGARAVALLWSSRMVDEAGRRREAFASIDPRRAAAGLVQLGLEPPEPWRDRANFDLSAAEHDAAAIDGFVEKLARAAGAPSAPGGEEAVERLRAAEEEAASWRAVRDLKTPEVFEAYLDRFGKKGLFASLARKRRVAARAARLASGEDSGAMSEGSRNLMIWAGGGALAASVVFGALALITGGDLRKLSGAPTEDVLALQSAAEYSADLDAELIETQETLQAAQEALEARNLAVAELEIALAEARSGEPGEGAPAGGAGEGARLVELAERQASLENELERKEAALSSASRRLTEAEAALAKARDRANQRSAEGGEALSKELEASRAETRRANRILEAARQRIEALEAERVALRKARDAAAPIEAAEEDDAVAKPGAVAEQPAEPVLAAPAQTPVAPPQAAASEIVQPAETVEAALRNESAAAEEAAAETPSYSTLTAAKLPRPRPAR